MVDKTFNKLNKSNFKFVADQQKPSPANWMTDKPRKGEGKQKLVSGDRYFWCGRCGYWNTTHKVNKCDKKSPKLQPTKKKKTEKSKSSDYDSANAGDATDDTDDAPASAEANYLSVDVSPEGDGWIFSPGYDQL